MTSVFGVARGARLLSLMMAVVLAGCGHSTGKKHETSAPVSVRVADVQPGPVSRVVEAGGSLHGVQEAVLAAKVMGSVIEIRKRAGDPVKRGEVLIVLDDREVAGNIGQAEGALAQAEAAASLAESNYKRYQLLFERGSASQLELDQARFAHESAQGAVTQARAAKQTAGSYESYESLMLAFTKRCSRVTPSSTMRTFTGTLLRAGATHTVTDF